MHAIPEMKKYSNVKFNEPICSKRLENIIKKYYSRYNFNYLETNGEIFLNSKKIGEV